MYLRLVSEGCKKWDAVDQVRKSYQNITLLKKRKYTATDKDIGLRRGAHPRDMKKKPGRKRKFSTKTCVTMNK